MIFVTWNIGLNICIQLYFKNTCKTTKTVHGHTNHGCWLKILVYKLMFFFKRIIVNKYILKYNIYQTA